MLVSVFLYSAAEQYRAHVRELESRNSALQTELTTARAQKEHLVEELESMFQILFIYISLCGSSIFLSFMV